MPVSLKHRLVSELGRLFEKQDTFSFGSACSGSDLIQHYIALLFSRWSQDMGVQLKAEWTFACELDPEKQEFLID
jgi:hypothetical protein